MKTFKRITALFLCFVMLCFCTLNSFAIDGISTEGLFDIFNIFSANPTGAPAATCTCDQSGGYHVASCPLFMCDMDEVYNRMENGMYTYDGVPTSIINRINAYSSYSNVHLVYTNNNVLSTQYGSFQDGAWVTGAAAPLTLERAVDILHDNSGHGLIVLSGDVTVTQDIPFDRATVTIVSSDRSATRTVDFGNYVATVGVNLQGQMVRIGEGVLLSATGNRNRLMTVASGEFILEGGKIHYAPTSADASIETYAVAVGTSPVVPLDADGFPRTAGVTIASTGKYSLANAYGYTFGIRDPDGDGVIDGEDTIIMTSQAAYEDGNPKWAVNIVLEPTGKTNEYRIVTCFENPQTIENGLAKFTWGTNTIVLLVHSDGNYPDSPNSRDEATYPNWKSEAAARALKTGDILKIDSQTTDGVTTYNSVTVVSDANGNVPDGLYYTPGIFTIKYGWVYGQENSVLPDAISTLDNAPGMTSLYESSGIINAGAVIVKDGGTFDMQGGYVFGFRSDSNLSNDKKAHAVTIMGKSTMNMSGGVIYNNGNPATSGGAVYVPGTSTTDVDGGGTFNMTGGTIRNNSGGQGGALRIQNYSKGTMSGNATISHNFDRSGGAAIRIAGAEFTMDGGVIEYNVCEGKDNDGNLHGDGGGAVAIVWDDRYAAPLPSKFVMNGGSVSNNTSGAYGGGIMIRANYLADDAECEVYINGGTISNNTALDYGAGICMGLVNLEPSNKVSPIGAPNIKVTVNNAIISDNIVTGAGGMGGAIYQALGEMTVTNSTITGNQAENGGAAYVGISKTEIEAYTYMTNLDSAAKEAELENYVSHVDLGEGNVISGNIATANGGAFYTVNCDVDMTAGTVERNEAVTGGALYVSDGGFTMHGGTFDSNTASGDGGAVYVNGGNAIVESGTISKNKAQNGAALAINNGNVIVGISTCNGITIPDGHTCPLITENIAKTNGGAFYVTGGTTEMYCGVLQRNVAEENRKSSSFYMSNGTFTVNGGNLDKVDYSAGGTFIDNRNGQYRARFYKETVPTIVDGEILDEPLIVLIITDGKIVFPGEGLHSELVPDGEKILLAWLEYADYGDYRDEHFVGTTDDMLNHAHFYPKWVDKTYNITYDLGGTVNNPITDEGNNPQTYDVSIDESVISLTPPKRSGYVFTGWTLTLVGDDGNWETNAEPRQAFNKQFRYGDIKLTANWTDSENTITYHMNGGIFPDGITPKIVFTQNELPYTLPHPVKTGYAFAGWTNKGETTPSLTATVISGTTGKLEYTANWVAVEYTVTLDSNGSADDFDETAYTIEQTLNLPTPTRPGYTFDGWMPRESVGNWNSADYYKGEQTSKYGNVNLVAQWTEYSVTISYIVISPQGAVDFGSISKELEELLAATGVAEGSTATVGAGFIFEGWFSDANCTQKVSDELSFVPAKGANGIWSTANYYAKFNYGYTDLIITSDCADQNQSFIFVVKNSGETVTGETVYLQVVLTGNDSVTITHVPFGAYVIEETNGWSWRYDPQTKEIELSAIQTNQVDFDYTSVRTLFWLSGDSYYKEWWGSEDGTKEED